jgi:hypothetical protein
MLSRDNVKQMAGCAEDIRKYYAVLCKLEHSWILVSLGILEPISMDTKDQLNVYEHLGTLLST